MTWVIDQRRMCIMRTVSKSIVGLAVGLGLFVAAPADAATSLAGRWDATVLVNGAVIPFRLDIVGEGSAVKGVLYNGDDQETTTSAKVQNGAVVLKLEHYLTTIVASEKDGQIDGAVHIRGDKGPEGNPFHASRYVPRAVAAGSVPSIDGVWEIPHETNKGEKAWRFIVKQSGADVSAAILRVDGDTGALTGRYQDGAFVL